MYHKNGVAKSIVLLSLIKANYNCSGNTIFVIHKLPSLNLEIAKMFTQDRCSILVCGPFPAHLTKSVCLFEVFYLPPWHYGYSSELLISRL